MKKARSVLVGVATAIAFLSVSGASHAAWLTPTAEDALKAHSQKVPAEFAEWTQYALDDGTLRVIGTVSRRDAVTKAAVAATTEKVVWGEVVPGFVARITPSQLPSLLALPAVRRLEADRPLDYSLAVSARDVRARDSIWSFDPAGGPMGALTSAHDALDVGAATGKGITIAVIDSGIDGTHRDFGGFDCTPAPYEPCASRIKHQTNLDHVLGLGFDYETVTNDYASGHGTHVAGIAAGNGFSARDGDVDVEGYGADGIPIGVAPEASLVSVKNGETLWAGLGGLGLDWVLAHHAEYGIRVVNNSWGCLTGCGYSPDSFDSLAIKGLYEAGVLVTFASGNGGGTESGTAFAGNGQSPYALSIANYDYRNNRMNSGSSRGVGTTTLADPATWTPESEGANGVRRPDLAAPGTLVWSARNLTGGAASVVPRVNTNDVIGGGSNGYQPYTQMSGTSMSTPHVSGAGALLFSACPGAGVLDVMRALMAGANPTKVLATDGSRVARPFEAGYGALDVRASLDWLAANVDACSFLTPNAVPTAAITSTDTATATEAVTFDATGSSDDRGIVSYAWDFGDGAQKSGARVSHAFARSGTYTVTLTVVDESGLTASATRTVTVANAAPTAAFSSGAARALSSTAFDGGGSRDRDGAVTAYAWDFGDGATATGATVGHAYTWAGDYVVRLTVTDDEGATNTTSRTVTVTDTPATGFKRLDSSGLTNHRCATDAWTFQLKPIAAGDSPASVAVVWADGSRERVARTSSKTGATVYTTSASLSQIATKAWADVPAASSASFTLLSGPCH